MPVGKNPLAEFVTGGLGPSGRYWFRRFIARPMYGSVAAAVSGPESFTSRWPRGSAGDRGGVVAAMAGDRLAELYKKFGPAIYTRCRRLLKDDVAAEDATQEVFLRVLKHLESAPSDEAALAWIYRISTNYCLNALRDQSRHAEPVSEVPEQPGEHPESGMLERDLALRLLMRAPENLRAPAMLYYVDGLEQQQIADTLGISRRTVINRLGAFAERARKYLARESVNAA
jgi:RNA polymerase sigma-70 factor (ECF subfamily)